MRGGSQTPVLQHIFFVLCLAVFVTAVPIPVPGGVTIQPSPTGNLTVFDPTTLRPIQQFPATDAGAGRVAAFLWIFFGLGVGVPYGVAGVRGGRLSVGAACGLAGVVLIWAAFVNALPMPLSDTVATADLIFTVVLLGTFIFLTFLGTFLSAMHPFGLGLLGVAAGTSAFMRIVIIKGVLLIPIYPLDLALLGLGGILGGILVVCSRRYGVILSTSLISTFLVGLSIDLILNLNAPQEQGMSRGLRFLMDRNPAHLVDIIGTSYNPALKSQIVIAVSLGLVPVLVYIQHRVFGGPFSYSLRRTQDDVETVYEKDLSGNIGQLAIGGPFFGSVGNGSRFSL